MRTIVGSSTKKTKEIKTERIVDLGAIKSGVPTNVSQYGVAGSDIKELETAKNFASKAEKSAKEASSSAGKAEDFYELTKDTALGVQDNIDDSFKYLEEIRATSIKIGGQEANIDEAEKQVILHTTAAENAAQITSDSATSARASEANSAASASSASVSAATSSTKAKEASTSATHAANSALAASNSAAAALISERAAKTSETNSKASKDASALSASAANISEGIATTAKNQANISATTAAKSATAALTAKTQAETSATSAANSASAALASKNATATSATNAAGSAATASTKAGEASSSASSALASKNAAALSDASATASKVASKASEDAAKVSELAAYASELGSSANAVEADASESAAKTSEVNSIANATASYNYSELSRGYANAAEISKGESQTAAENADNSADKGLLSANAAKASELIAKASEVASKASEIAAKASATASKASELAAKASETTANTKAVQTAANAVTTAGHVTQTANNAALAEIAKKVAEAAASTIVGGIVDKGAWNASTGVFPEKPTRSLPEGGTALVSGFWKVTVAGTAGGISFLAGDDLRFSAGTDTFYKIDNTDAVASVQGKTGAVVLAANEVGALATPTGTHTVNTVLVAGATAGTSKHSGFTLGKSVPSNAVFTDTVYTHPTNDGNLHIPATGTTNNGKALIAGATAGSVAWKTLTSSDISGLGAALNAKLDATANAVSATKLQKPVTVNGIAFDGSANITISASSPATLTRGTGLTGANYNGASATTWAVAYGTAAGTACQGNDARLGDARNPLAHSHVWADVTGKPTTLAGYGITDAPNKTGVGASGSWGISVTGNAATATRLATARTINGVSFDGSANITVYDSTKLPLTGGTLTGTLTTRLDSASSMMNVKTNATAGWTYDVMSAGTTATSGVGTVHLAYKSIADGSVPAQSYHIRVGGATTQFAVNASGVYSYVGLTAPTFYGALSGNATTATTLQTARTLTIGSTGKTFNGSTNASWSLAEIGAAAASHTHAWAQVTGAPAYATRWPTLGEIGAQPAGSYAASSHTHAWSQVTGAPATATRWPTFAEVSGKPTTYTPSAHTHDDRYNVTHKFNAVVRQGTWSRIARTNIVALGGTYLLALNHTRNSVVVNALFLVSTNHSNSSRISQLSSGNYTQVQVRLTDAGADDVYIEVLDTAGVAGDHLYNAWLECKSSGNATPYSSFTAGGGTVRASIQSAYTDFIGSGSGLTTLNASNLSSGVVPNAHLPTTATRWPTFAEVTAAPATATRWPTFGEVSGKPTNYATTWESVAAKPATAIRWPTLAEIGAQPAGSYAAASHTHTPSQVGLGNVPNTVHTTAATASTVAVRDSAGDIACRLLRPNYANEASISGALAYRVNNSTDNYVRFCSDTAAIRTWLGVAAASHTHAYAPLTGGGTSGTWPISVAGTSGGTTGNAATATVLQTARTLTIGSTGKSFNGSANVAWSLAEIGAQPAGSYAAASHTHTELVGSNYASGGSELPNYFGGGKLTYRMLGEGGTKGGIAGSAYSDAIWVSSYTGGDVKRSNVLLFSKDGAPRVGFRQQDYDATTWGTFNEIYHTGKKPTAGDVGALPLGGGTLTGILATNQRINQFKGYGNASTDLNTLLSAESGIWNYASNVNASGTPNIFPATNNANGVLTFNTHNGQYGRQIGFSSNGAMYTRHKDGTDWSTWRKMYDDANKPTAAEIGAQPAGSYAAASHTHPWAQITGVPVQATRWPNSTEVGLGNVGNYTSSTRVEANTHALRDVNGDLVARQFHGTHVGDGSNLFNLQWARLTGVPVTATRWPTLAEIGAASAAHSHHATQIKDLNLSTVAESKKLIFSHDAYNVGSLLDVTYGQVQGKMVTLVGLSNDYLMSSTIYVPTFDELPSVARNKLVLALHSAASVMFDATTTSGKMTPINTHIRRIYVHN